MTESEQLRSPTVVDTTVLSSFAYTGDLDVLDGVPARLVTVAAVHDELRAGVENGYDFFDPAIEAVERVAFTAIPIRLSVTHSTAVKRTRSPQLTSTTGRSPPTTVLRANSPPNVRFR